MKQSSWLVIGLTIIGLLVPAMTSAQLATTAATTAADFAVAQIAGMAQPADKDIVGRLVLNGLQQAAGQEFVSIPVSSSYTLISSVESKQAEYETKAAGASVPQSQVFQTIADRMETWLRVARRPRTKGPNLDWLKSWRTEVDGRLDSLEASDTALQRQIAQIRKDLSNLDADALGACSQLSSELTLARKRQNAIVDEGPKHVRKTERRADEWKPESRPRVPWRER